MIQINPARLKNDRCVHCGASEGIHRYGDLSCPWGGREETRRDHQQQWVQTTFEDSGLRQLHAGAAGLAAALDQAVLRILEAPPAKRDTMRRTSDQLALHDARQAMEHSGVASQCPTYPRLANLENALREPRRRDPKKFRCHNCRSMKPVDELHLDHEYDNDNPPKLCQACWDGE